MYTMTFLLAGLCMLQTPTDGAEEPAHFQQLQEQHRLNYLASPNAPLCALSTNDYVDNIAVVDLRTGKINRIFSTEFPVFLSRHYLTRFSPDGRQLVMGEPGNQWFVYTKEIWVTLCDVESGKSDVFWREPLLEGTWICATSFSDDSKRFALAIVRNDRLDKNKGKEKWELLIFDWSAKPKLVTRMTSDDPIPVYMAFSKDNTQIAGLMEDGHYRVWNINDKGIKPVSSTFCEFLGIEPKNINYRVIEFNVEFFFFDSLVQLSYESDDDGSHLREKLLVISLPKQEELETLALLPEEEYILAISADKRKLAIHRSPLRNNNEMEGAKSNQLLVYDVASKKYHKLMEYGTKRWLQCQFADNGKYLIVKMDVTKPEISDWRTDAWSDDTIWKIDVWDMETMKKCKYSK